MKIDFLVELFTLGIRLLRSELSDATSSWQGKAIGRTLPLAQKQYVILKASGDRTSLGRSCLASDFRSLFNLITTLVYLTP